MTNKEKKIEIIVNCVIILFVGFTTLITINVIGNKYQAYLERKNCTPWEKEADITNKYYIADNEKMNDYYAYSLNNKDTAYSHDSYEVGQTIIYGVTCER